MNISSENPDFHEPSKFEASKFWQPLRHCSWPTKNLPDFCLISGDLLAEHDNSNKNDYATVYFGCLFIYSYSRVTAGMELVSLAVRKCLEFIKANPSSNLDKLLKEFFDDIIRQSEKSLDFDDSYLRLGQIYLENRDQAEKEYLDYIKSPDFENTDSLYCSERWCHLFEERKSNGA